MLMASPLGQTVTAQEVSVELKARGYYPLNVIPPPPDSPPLYVIEPVPISPPPLTPPFTPPIVDPIIDPIPITPPIVIPDPPVLPVLVDPPYSPPYIPDLPPYSPEPDFPPISPVIAAEVGGGKAVWIVIAVLGAVLVFGEGEKKPMDKSVQKRRRELARRYARARKERAV